MDNTAQLIQNAVERIVDRVQPRRIFLFGSAARGEMHEDSDLDFLVVIPDGRDCMETAFMLHRCLRGLGRPKDIVVICEKDLQLHGDNPFLIIHTAVTEGREVYHAA